MRFFVIDRGGKFFLVPGPFKKIWEKVRAENYIFK